MRRPSNAVLVALALLYTAQGVPFGFAAEYLPVALRQQGYTTTAIAFLGVGLQLPWQLKFLYAHLADRPSLRPHARSILLTLQLVLFAVLAGLGWRPLKEAPALWFALTFAAALFASSQDTFVDALAVRSLDPTQRGFGNTAQVAGYRLGMLAGGAGLLLLIGSLGSRRAVLVCATIVLVTAACAFALRDHSHGDGAASAGKGRLEAKALVKHMLGERAWRVIVLALTYKLGLHMASFLIKPMVVDAKWTDREIGLAVVGAGTTAGLLGAVVGGALHRIMDERRALVTGVVLQSLVCLPLFFVLTLGAPKGWTTTAIVAENLASGVGTTVLFAALMTATRRNDAGMHYTLLTTGNNVAIFAGTTLSGVLADHLGKGPVLVLAAIVCLLPLGLLTRWNEAAAASAGAELPA